MWDSGYDSWSRLYISPDRELWIYHWDIPEWEYVYREDHIVPASLAFSTLWLYSSESTIGGNLRVFYGGTDMLFQYAGFESPATYAYDRNGEGNVTTICHYFIYGTPEARAVMSELVLNWTSESGGTYTETSTEVFNGEITTRNDLGDFEWVPPPG